MKRLGPIAIAIILLIGLIFTGCAPTLPPEYIMVKEGWKNLAEGLTAAGEILQSIDTGLVETLVETPGELASTYINVSYPLDSCSSNLSDLGAGETATIVASMATHFRETGYALAGGDFASVANALSNLANQFEVLADPVLKTDALAILEAFQNTIHQFTLQAGIARMISDPSPWIEELGGLLDFYNAHTIEELQEFASALLTEVNDPEERARFGLDDPEMVATLENLSVILTSGEFQEWVSIARLDLFGWLNQASQETFILETKELGYRLYALGYLLTSSYTSILPYITTCKHECPEVCVNRNCEGKVVYSGNLVIAPKDIDTMLIVTYVPKKTPGTGYLIRQALKALDEVLMKHQWVAVWIKVSWEHCELKRCIWHLWLSSYRRWVKEETDWQLVSPPPGSEFEGPRTGSWLGRNFWNEALCTALDNAIINEMANKCPGPS